MPLAVGTQQPVIVVPPVIEEVYTASWTAPDGTEWPLMEPQLGWHTLDFVSGYGAVPILVSTDAAPEGGLNVRNVQDQGRYITWPLRIQSDQHSAMLANWRALAKAFTLTKFRNPDSTGRPGTLTITRPDGSARRIQAYYVSGFEGLAGGGWWYDEAPITLLCPDPYWRDVNGQQVVATFVDTAQPDFLDPYPSVSFAQAIGATVSINNPGDADAFPVWTVDGPADAVTCTNHTTGDTWTLDPDFTPPSPGSPHGPLLLGETVILTARPPTVRGPSGEKWQGAINRPTGKLWKLPPGISQVEFAFTSPSSGSAISMSFDLRYETA